MNPDKLNPGSEELDSVTRLYHWCNNMANNLHNGNALWYWAAKASHEFMEWRGKGVMDPVLHCLFAMGLFDWSAPNNCLNQTTPAMCYVMVIALLLDCREQSKGSSPSFFLNLKEG